MKINGNSKFAHFSFMEFMNESEGRGDGRGRE